MERLLFFQAGMMYRLHGRRKLDGPHDSDVHIFRTIGAVIG